MLKPVVNEVFIRPTVNGMPAYSSFEYPGERNVDFAQDLLLLPLKDDESNRQKVALDNKKYI